MTRIVGKICKNTKEIEETNLQGAAAPRRDAAGGSAFVFFIFLSIFVYFANNPSHWDGNPGIGIVNPNNPKQSQSRQRPVHVADSRGTGPTFCLWAAAQREPSTGLEVLSCDPRTISSKVQNMPTPLRRGPKPKPALS